VCQLLLGLRTSYGLLTAVIRHTVQAGLLEILAI